MTARIALLGASGAVGRATLDELGGHHASPKRPQQASERYEFRLGGRDPESLKTALGPRLPPGAEIRRVDLRDSDALARFCAGSAVVVNCAGPAHLVGDRVARAALAAGAHYVDPGGESLHRELTAADPGPMLSQDRTALVSAGMTPGLSALLPRMLADGFDRVTRLCVHAGGLDRFTPAAAGDYVASLSNGYGRSLAAWRHGRVRSGVLPRRERQHLPYFTGPVTAHPYLSAEMERLAKRLGLIDLDWYNVFAGDQVLAALGRAGRHPGDAAGAVTELIAAADRDLLVHHPYQLFVVRLDGTAGGRPAGRTLVLRAADSYRLTGCVTALATVAVLDRGVPAGVHFAGEVLDTRRAEQWLRGSDAVSHLHVADTPGQSADAVAEAAEEEGAL
ncbi:saccharopine dehydrogenase NADP-binding domain-containing protein [Streptomyces sp. NPDC050211]|uniref:saccharopine dehydrogenase NADP-binding domain-containing protein n=1 Tax=Streptomyces sp. NPDC050211 TaxID=3154932 RepID=UPI0034186E8C